MQNSITLVPMATFPDERELLQGLESKRHSDRALESEYSNPLGERFHPLYGTCRMRKHWEAGDR